MPIRHPANAPLPRLWLLSDARNDASLAAAIAAMPRGSGLIVRHYHLDGAARRARFEQLAKAMHRRGGMVVLAGDPVTARRWRADGVYGAAAQPGRASAALVRLATAHGMAEIGRANRARADLVLLSPVFATRSHPGARTLGMVRFLLLVRYARVPVIALGGMTLGRARRMPHKVHGYKVHGWAAIDGLSGRNRR